MADPDLRGRVALVTGAARGIGAAIARRLAAGGASVLVTDVEEEGARTSAAAIVEEGGEAAGLRLDVSDEGAWAAAIDALINRFGALDVLVNNAGVASAARPLEVLSLESWRRLTSINLDGVFLGTKHAIPHLAERAGHWHGGAAIVNVSSVMGFVGGRNAAAYCASKGGVRLFTKAAALELAPKRIRVNSIHPGFIDTPLFRAGVARMEAAEPGSGESFRSAVINRHPLGRLGAADDIADGVAYLVSDAAAFVTGTELVVDGGYLAQ
ncbi:MAG: SDR family NAD(P)-dependent oxidoreductase [Pseudomonadales bacterium]